MQWSEALDGRKMQSHLQICMDVDHTTHFPGCRPPLEYSVHAFLIQVSFCIS